MAHEVESMGFDYEWLGNRMPWWDGMSDAPTARRFTPEETLSVQGALKASGLDWEVEKTPLFQEVWLNGIQQVVKIPDEYGVRRKSDNKILVSGVTEDYHCFQNLRAFEWFVPFLDAGVGKIVSAMSLRGGKRIAIQLGILFDEKWQPVDGSTITRHISLATSHDRSLATSPILGTQRIECANTLALAISTGKRIRIKHSSKQEENLAIVRETINVARLEFEANAEQWRALARKGIHQDDKKKYVHRVLFKDEEDYNELSTRAKNIIDQVITDINEAPGADPKTWWGAYNGVSYYLTHEAGRSYHNRLDSMLFGKNGELNKEAMQVAIEMAA